ncbi:hypothetical protein [Streptomyces sp. NBC_00645]|uniref:RipA family octameric membrane protein n=1 Tax=Streptomyces sp. NBC_00645 TaxID=2975795 RepID=UPI003250E83D
MSSSTPRVGKLLWNRAITPATYDSQERYQAAVLEQYKVCIDMADKVSQRRMLANTFFLTLNTAILTIIGVFWRKSPTGSPAWLVVPLIALVLQCGAWFWLLCSYRQLSKAKFEVVGGLEARLPASPFVGAEWELLSKGNKENDYGRYVPLARLEIWVPISFALIYVGGFIALLLA